MSCCRHIRSSSRHFFDNEVSKAVKNAVAISDVCPKCIFAPPPAFDDEDASILMVLSFSYRFSYSYSYYIRKQTTALYSIRACTCEDISHLNFPSFPSKALLLFVTRGRHQTRKGAAKRGWLSWREHRRCYCSRSSRSSRRRNKTMII